MVVEQIWNEFKIKLQNDGLTSDDFSDETRKFLMPFLSGENTKSLRDFIFNANNVQFLKSEQEQKYIVYFAFDDISYRFDFIDNSDKWQLLFMECITIPIDRIESVPFNNFAPLIGDGENWIREEVRITELVRNYNLIKDNFGIDKALEYYRDGAGKFLAAKSWIPFFSDKKAFIVYIAWWDNRIQGEKVFIEKFSDGECIIKYIDSIWFRMYKNTGHLKLQIPFDEYKNLYEYIWQDRAKCSGWKIMFIYENDTIILKFN